jgi:hypothetical protein
MVYKKPEGVLNEEDIIPAATYEPSDSSEEFQIQVNKMFGKESGPSGSNDRVGLARCEYSQQATKMGTDLANSEGGRSAVGLFEGGMEEYTEKNVEGNTQVQELENPEDDKQKQMATEEEADGFDVTKLKNPCEASKEAREERRWSERVQEIAAKKNQKDIPVETTFLKGNNIPSNSFSALSNAEIIDRSI